jgi:hypothetical protein
VEDVVTFSIQAYDENYEPLTDSKLQGNTMVAELTAPARGGGSQAVRELPLSMLRVGEYEVRFPVYTPGDYKLRVKDPITQEYMEYPFEVTSLSAEQRDATRNLALQRELAIETSGKSYDLTTVSSLPADIRTDTVALHSTNNHELWSTPLWFIAAMALMLGEWLSRKLMNMT